MRIGLGGIGRGLAKNMVAKGSDPTVTDLDPARIAGAVRQGETEGGNPAEGFSRWLRFSEMLRAVAGNTVVASVRGVARSVSI